MRLISEGGCTGESVAGNGIGPLIIGRRREEGSDISSVSATRGLSEGNCSDFPVDSCLEMGSAEENDGFSDIVEGVARESVEEERGGIRGLSTREEVAEFVLLLQESRAET